MTKFREIVESIISNTFKENDNENDLEYARNQVKAWKDKIHRLEIADNFYYTNGKYNNDSQQLKYWINKVEELERASRTPEENDRIDAEKAKEREEEDKRREEWHKEQERKRQEEMDKADKEWHYNQGDIVRDKETGKEWEVDQMFRKYDDREHKFYYDYWLKGIGDNAGNTMRSGNFPLNRQNLYEPVSKKD